MRILICAIVSAFTMQVHADMGECKHATAGGVPFDYCLYRSMDPTNTDLVYFLHGAGESERAWTRGNFGPGVEAAWRAQGRVAPTVVAISFSSVWLLASENESRYSGLYDTFVNHVMKYIEADVLNGWHGRRLLFGYSMGGYNGVQLYLKNPELFARYAIGCPAIVNVSPFAPRAEVDAYTDRTHANPSLVAFMLGVSKTFYRDETAYAKDAPLALAERTLSPNSPPVHLSCGDRDGFGFQEGSALFEALLTTRGVAHEWQLLPGGHCVIDTEAVAKFLVAP